MMSFRDGEEGIGMENEFTNYYERLGAAYVRGISCIGKDRLPGNRLGGTDEKKFRPGSCRSRERDPQDAAKNVAAGVF